MRNKKLKWWAWTLISVAICVVLSLSGLLIYYFEFMPKDTNAYIQGIENPHGFSALGIRPEGGTLLEINLNNYSLPEDYISLAAMIYNTAAVNAKEADYMAYYNQCQSVFSLNGMENFIDVDVVAIKTQEQFFRSEYHLKNNIPLFNLLPGAEAAINKLVTMVTTERVYADRQMDYAIYQKVLNNAYDEAGTPYANWDTDITEERINEPIYYRGQEGAFSLTLHRIDTQTIKSASITYNQGGWYEVSIILDEKNPLTSEFSVEPIRKGTGDKNASFTEIRLDFTVWDNGYFKELDMFEKWSASVWVFPVGSSFDSRCYFSYSADDANFNEYKDALDMKIALGK